MTRNVIIIGAGPSGLTSAIYTARANLEPLMFAGEPGGRGGTPPGGQLMITTDVENFPGFPEGIMGPKLMMDFRAQAERFGAEIRDADVSEIDFSSRPFRVTSNGETHEARTVIISTGARPRMLGLEAENTLMGHGLSTCATCDGAFFRDKEIMVIGGGDTAMEEALFLTRFGSKVVIVHRRDEFRASKIMADRALEHPKVEVVWNSTLTDVLPDENGKVRAAVLRDVNTGDTTERPIAAVFYAIGHIPNTQLFEGTLDLDENGYMKVQSGSTRTNIEGVFAAGDVADHVYRQAITAAGTGCMAAIDAERYLESQGA